MGMLVLDCSVTMAWLFREEFTPYVEPVLDEVTAGLAVVPAIWPLEVANVLLSAERRGRILQAEGGRFLSLLAGLPIDVSVPPDRQPFDELLPLARETELSVYDAGYLELAATHGLPLATLDERLKGAARQLGVALLD